MTRLLAIETRLGRVREIKWGNRTIDLDLLMWRAADGTTPTFEDEAVRIPHPYLLDRDFALVPAAAVAPTWVHPVSGLTLADEVARRHYHLS
jgi:2-amino-4-hydroxy-6-hydroxymethyldihydropteridine diphosphokinase